MLILKNFIENCNQLWYMAHCGSLTFLDRYFSFQCNMYWTIVIFLELKCSHSCLLDHYCAKKSEFINLFLDWLWMENVKEWIWWFMLLWAPFRDLILGCKKEQTRRKRHLWQHAFKIYNIDNDFTFSLDMHFDWKIVDCF